MSKPSPRIRRILDALKDALRVSRRKGWQASADRIAKARKDLRPPEHVAPAPKPAPKPAKPVWKATPRALEAIRRVRRQSHEGPTFKVNECRLRCRLAMDTASVGDFDGDGAADAEDAWKAAQRKHPGERKAPRGAFVYWLGGSSDNGHIAISAGIPGNALSNALRALFGRQLETWVWSTDIRRAGRFDYVPLSYITQKWGPGLQYAGWVEDDHGTPIIENGAAA